MPVRGATVVETVVQCSAPGGYVAVPMAGGLRYIHPYPSTPTSASVPAVATMVTSASSAPTPVPVPAPAAAPANPPTVSQTPPPSLSGTAYAARDAYRSATTNVGIFLFDLSHDKSSSSSPTRTLSCFHFIKIIHRKIKIIVENIHTKII